MRGTLLSSNLATAYHQIHRSSASRNQAGRPYLMGSFAGIGVDKTVFNAAKGGVPEHKPQDGPDLRALTTREHPYANLDLQALEERIEEEP
jgi:hypothetical protein